VNPGKVMRIAGREFASTVLTKGFIIGALVVPAVIAVIMPLVIMLVNSAKPPADKGELAIIDRSGEVTPLVADLLDPERIVESRRDQLEAMRKIAGEMLGSEFESLTGDQLGAMSDEQLRAFLEQFGVPQLRVTELPGDTDVESQQARLRENLGGGPRGEDRGLLAIAVVDDDAVVKDPADDQYGAFSVFTVPKLDDRTVSEIRGALRRAILDRRYDAAGMDRATIDALTSVNAQSTQEVTETGTRESAFELQMLIPGAFMLLMLMGVMTGGQYLLTTTIEEKSSRVVEVLLSAVSSVELMTGKIVGQMAVGLTLLLVYNAVGIIALFVFQRLDLIDGMTIAWMLVFFALAYFMFASIMAAIGSAVNELREAQALMTPVMLFVMIPYFFFLPVTRDPSSVLSTTLSFIPPSAPSS
jgi:ABC-2 type transport system permease protein